MSGETLRYPSVYIVIFELCKLGVPSLINLPFTSIYPLRSELVRRYGNNLDSLERYYGHNRVRSGSEFYSTLDRGPGPRGSSINLYGLRVPRRCLPYQAPAQMLAPEPGDVTAISWQLRRFSQRPPIATIFVLSPGSESKHLEYVSTVWFHREGQSLCFSPELQIFLTSLVGKMTSFDSSRFAVNLATLPYNWVCHIDCAWCKETFSCRTQPRRASGREWSIAAITTRSVRGSGNASRGLGSARGINDALAHHTFWKSTNINPSLTYRRNRFAYRQSYTPPGSRWRCGIPMPFPPLLDAIPTDPWSLGLCRGNRSRDTQLQADVWRLWRLESYVAGRHSGFPCSSFSRFSFVSLKKGPVPHWWLSAMYRRP